MRTTVTELDDELQADFKQNVSLSQELADRQAKNEALSRELKRERQLLSERQRVIQAFARDLHRLVAHTDPAGWREAILQLYK